ncbi:RHS repeat domain-containing protein [Thermoflexibacter ruber]|nr:RHS repeat-associated core domain-containing protein [Thermoflexibacter ruber]
MTLPVGTTSIVAYMKYEGGTEVYFDDLKIELSAVPVAMVVQENHYYPFGLNMKGLDYVQTVNQENKFTFNGQTEKETKLNLHWHETAFRSYDPQLGRFHQIDPLADLFTGINPYQFGYNNPVMFNDPTGLASPTPSPAPPKKEPKDKTGNLIILIQGADYQDFRDAVNNAPENNNWNSISVTNIQDAADKVKQYRDEYGDDIQNLVISTHGNAGYIELDPLDEYKGLFSSTVQKYLNPETRRKTHSTYKSWIESLEIIASCMANNNNANLLFRSCFSGLPEEEGQLSFAELLGQLFDLGRKNKFNLFMNQDYSVGSYKYSFKGTDKKTKKKYDWFSQQIIDSPKARKYVNKSYPLYLTNPSDYRRGWLQITQDGEFTELGKLIPILQGIGMPIILQSIQNNK